MRRVVFAALCVVCLPVGLRLPIVVCESKTDERVVAIYPVPSLRDYTSLPHSHWW